MDSTSPALIQQPRRSIEDYIEQVKTITDKFLTDGMNGGDVKLLVTAVRELRYALKVFGPYRNRKKVTVFGSARTPVDHPSYEQAVKFSQRMAAEQYMVITGAANGIMEAGHVG